MLSGNFGAAPSRATALGLLDAASAYFRLRSWAKMSLLTALTFRQAAEG